MESFGGTPQLMSLDRKRQLVRRVAGDPAGAIEASLQTLQNIKERIKGLAESPDCIAAE